MIGYPWTYYKIPVLKKKGEKKIEGLSKRPFSYFCSSLRLSLSKRYFKYKVYKIFVR